MTESRYIVAEPKDAFNFISATKTTKPLYHLTTIDCLSPNNSYSIQN